MLLSSPSLCPLAPVLGACLDRARWVRVLEALLVSPEQPLQTKMFLLLAGLIDAAFLSGVGNDECLLLPTPSSANP